MVETDREPENATFYKAAFVTLDGHHSKSADMQIFIMQIFIQQPVLQVAASFHKSLEKFHYRAEINTDSYQACPGTA